jgi:hypothetical protein
MPSKNNTNPKKTVKSVSTPTAVAQGSSPAPTTAVRTAGQAPAPQATQAPSAVGPTTVPATQVTSVANGNNTGKKAALQTSYVALIAGLQANFAPDFVFDLPTGPMTTTELLATFGQFVQAAETTKGSYQTWRGDVQTERRIALQVAPTRTLVKVVLQSKYGKTSTQMLAFGFTPDKVPAKSAESKTVGAVKAKATRAARGTKGSKQKLAITGNVTGVTITPITSSPATPAPAAPAPATGSSKPVAS